MLIDRSQVDAAKRRYDERRAIREENKRLLRQGNPFAADTPKRVKLWLDRRGLALAADGVNVRETVVNKPGSEYAGFSAKGILERTLGRNDLLGVAFLEQGLHVARTVARVWVGVSAGQVTGYGTGFMVSPRLFLTNNHVLPDAETARASLVEFDYAISAGGQPKRSCIYATDPDAFFATSVALDYALVALAPATNEGRPLADFGWNTLLEEEGKAIGGQPANIIQHPGGQYKQLAFRQNLIVDVLDDFLHYESDTAQGSSGSPVYNDRWEVVALHHAGVWDTNEVGEILSVDGWPWRREMGEDRIKWKANEGTRISRLVKDLKRTVTDPVRGALLAEATSSRAQDRAAGDEVQVPQARWRSPVGGASVSVASDGTATWTIPISVTVGIGGAAVGPGHAATVLSGQGAPPAGPGRTSVRPDGEADRAALPALSPEAIAKAAQAEFNHRTDVLDVRLGWVFKAGWITDERALVVTVPRKLTSAELEGANVSSLPETFRGLPVEVVEPTIAETLRSSTILVASEALVFDLGVATEEISYVRPPTVSLAPIRADMRIRAHVSPDSGWPGLEAFIGRVRRDLTVGMYDFGAEHVARAVGALGRVGTFKAMHLVMQAGESTGSGTKRLDWTDDEAVRYLRGELAGKFRNAWVRIGEVNGWVARSYHIKVAVRDEEEVWLSSGNWQSSNQPLASPLSDQPLRRSWLESHNREWHVMVEHAGLAQTYAGMLMHDFEANKDFVPARKALPELFVPEEELLPSAQERARPFAYFPAFDASRVFDVEPLFTPDNFHERVLSLLHEAEEELLIQNQTFNAPTASQPQLRALMDAVLERRRRGVEVKIIFRILKSADARRNLERLKDFGFNPEDIKVQRNCHTKGIVVDRRAVLIGSQNWSSSGVSTNRDASLLVRDAELARYFGQIFDHDWHNLARRDVRQNAAPVEIGAAGTPPRSGYATLGWKDWVETL